VGSEGRCHYHRAYQEGSEQAGYFMKEVLTLGNPEKVAVDTDTTDTDWGYDSAPLAVAGVSVGLDTLETNLIRSQEADGIMGLGIGDYSVVDQFYNLGAIASRTTVVCYGNPFRTYWGLHEPNLGVLSLGDHPQVVDWAQPGGPVTWTKSVGGTSFHRVKLAGMRVGGAAILEGSSTFSKPVVLDSGTTFMYVPRDAHAGITRALKDHHASMGHPEVNGPIAGDVCWGGMEDAELEDLPGLWPQIALDFADGETIFLGMHQYTFLGQGGTFCSGIFPTSDSWLFGAVMHRDMFVISERDAGRVGFMSAPCTDLTVDPAALGPTPPPTPRPPTPAPTPGNMPTLTPAPPPGEGQGASYAGVFIGALIFLACGGGLAYGLYAYFVRNGPSRMDESAEFLPAEAFASDSYTVELGSVPRSEPRPHSAASRASPGVFSLASDSD